MCNCNDWVLFKTSLWNNRTAGEIFAVSLAQGGPAPCFMREWCYIYLTTGEVDVTRICKDDVDDVEYSLLITKVTSLWILPNSYQQYIALSVYILPQSNHIELICPPVVTDCFSLGWRGNWSDWIHRWNYQLWIHRSTQHRTKRCHN